MKRKFSNSVIATCLSIALVAGCVPAMGEVAKADTDISAAVESGLSIEESEINQLLTGDLKLPTKVTGLSDATISWSVGNANSKYVSISGDTLKVTRPYAGEEDYEFTLTATVKSGGSTATKEFPLTVRAGLSDDSYAGYIYCSFAVDRATESVDVQQVHFFLSEDGLKWTALNGCNPAFLAGTDFADNIVSYGGDSVNYYVKDGTDITETVTGDASVLFPFEGRDQGIRDPYIIRAAEEDTENAGKIWILATDLNTHSVQYDGDPAKNYLNQSTGWGKTATVGIGSTSIFVYETTDWIHWTRRYVDVGAEVEAGAAWAPEAVWDPVNENYVIYWSGRVDSDGSTRNRAYCNVTEDFADFGPTKLYEAEPYYKNYASEVSVNSGYGNIDTSMLWVADEETGEKYGTLYRVVKDETNNHIELMSAETVLDPDVDYDATEPIRITPYTLDGKEYTEKSQLDSLSGLKRADVVHNWFKNEVTGNHFTKISQKNIEKLTGAYEGATMFKFIDRDEWCIMIDFYGSMKVRYEPYTTTDLSNPDSVKKAESGTYGRTGGDIGTHGGMIPVTVEEYNNLINTYNADKTVDNYHKINYIEVDKRALEDKLNSLKAAQSGNAYSNNQKATIKKLAAQGEALYKAGDTTTKEIESFNKKADLVLANKGAKIPALAAEFVELSSYDLDMKAGATATLKATVEPAQAPQSITWSSSNPAVATVSSTGVVTAKKGGEAQIIAKASNGVSEYCNVTVTQAPNKLSVNSKKVTLKKGKTFQIEVTLPEYSYCDKFTYKSSNKKVATVSSKGKIKAKKKGKATITVTAKNNPKAKVKIQVTVK